MNETKIDFKRHRYPKLIILQAVYFKLRFTLSYRDIEELILIRGVKGDHSVSLYVFDWSTLYLSHTIQKA
jgi:putative transposase